MIKSFPASHHPRWWMHWWKPILSPQPPIFTHICTIWQASAMYKVMAPAFVFRDPLRRTWIISFFCFFFKTSLSFGPGCLYTYGHVSNALAIMVFKWQLNIFLRLREPTTILKKPRLYGSAHSGNVPAVLHAAGTGGESRKGWGQRGGWSWRTGKPRGRGCREGCGETPSWAWQCT